LHDRYGPKIAIPDQENSSSSKEQGTDIKQQDQLLLCLAMPFDMFDPGPGNGIGSFSVSQTDDQQLMSKTNLVTIHDQTDLTEMTELVFLLLSSNRSIHFPYPDGWIIQQLAHTSLCAQQLRQTWNLSGNSAQANRMALINANHQPDKIAHLSNSFACSQFLNSMIPGRIQGVDRHDDPPVKKFCGKLL
jgi:hypothetical protein